MHLEDSYCDQSGECCGENISGVQNRYSRCQFLSRIEDAQHVKGPRIKGGFSHTKEEAGK